MPNIERKVSQFTGSVQRAGLFILSFKRFQKLSVDSVVGDNGSHGSSVDFRNHLGESPKHAIVVETGRLET
jgi:hypothetical protein